MTRREVMSSHFVLKQTPPPYVNSRELETARSPQSATRYEARSSRLAYQRHTRVLGDGNTDAEADMVSPESSTAICVQRFDGSRNSAIHTTYRISLRSSSLREPRYPLLRVVFGFSNQQADA